MTAGIPVLSLITWAPFVGALLIMFTARHRPRAVRLIAAISTGVSAALALWLYVAYDRQASGFQFYEKLPLVPPLGINYELAVDGMSLLMVLLTGIIIFAGVFASWTVASRSQEFYALLLALVTGVFGVFVSLDLFVLFLFYELAVLPMYLLIGIWGSTGEVRPRGIFAWAYRETGVGTKEYAAMKLTLYLLFGSESSPCTHRPASARSRSSTSRAWRSIVASSAGCSWPSTSDSGSSPVSGRCTRGRPMATLRRRRRSRCFTPACS